VCKVRYGEAGQFRGRMSQETVKPICLRFRFVSVFRYCTGYFFCVGAYLPNEDDDEQRIIAFLTEECCYLNLRSKVRTQLR